MPTRFRFDPEACHRIEQEVNRSFLAWERFEQLACRQFNDGTDLLKTENTVCRELLRDAVGR